MLYLTKMSALLGLECPECGSTYPADLTHRICARCDSPLLARYDLDGLSSQLSREEVASRSPSLWRWQELLPVDDPAFRVTLGEGDTPILPAPRLAEQCGLEAVFVKDEGRNPTGTFKARGMAVAVSRAAELGVRECAVPTAGNAGGALAAYAARAGLRSHVVMPADASLVHRLEVEAAGADLRLVDGLIDRAGKVVAQEARRGGWWDLSTFREPYRVEGKKTMGFELAQAFDWGAPEFVFYPTGGGTGLVGIWKAYEELAALGWTEVRRPKMVCVQAEGCAPVVRALAQGDERVERWEEAATLAQGLRVPHPYADRLILRTVRASGGFGVAVGEDEIRQAQADLARGDGILACPEGAAAVAALRHAARDGRVRRHDTVVLLNTGTGLKSLL
jgi:threonine synthase